MTTAVDRKDLRSNTMAGDRLKRDAGLARIRQELAGPVEALLQYAHRLRDLAPEECPAAFLKAVRNIVLRSQQLFELVDRHFEAVPGEGEQAEQYERKIRHDLRGHAGYVINICQLWQMQAPAQLLERFLPELERISKTANQVVLLLDKLVQFGTQGSDSDIPPDDLDALQRYMEQLPASGQRGRLLVVDDNDANRELMVELLSLQGHEVTPAANGIEALLLVAAQSFDLVLLDVLMPGLSGLEVLEQLKAEGASRHIPVLMISALDTMDSAIQCVARGAEDYLARPVHPLLLQVRIAACLEKKQLRDREQIHLRRIDELLHAIFPPQLVDELKETQTIRSRRFEKVGVLFLDVVGFTPYCDARRDRPEEVVAQLQEHVLAFEQIARKHGVQKIKTIGDAFMAAAGLLQPCSNPVRTLLNCGLEMIETTRSAPAGWQVRVGIHVGPVVAGVLGQSQYSFDLWGNTVNVAARMESHGLAGRVTLSPEAWQEVSAECEGDERETHVKGMGPVRLIDFRRFRSHML